MTGPQETRGGTPPISLSESPPIEQYFPLPESSGGWRRLVSINATPTSAQKVEIRSTAGLDWDILKQAWDNSVQYGGTFLVIRHGWIAAEWGTTAAMGVASCTKSFTSLVMHRIFEMSANQSLFQTIDPDDFVHAYLPASWGSNLARQAIQIRHLLTMSSGLAPDDNPPSPNGSTAAYEQKLFAPPIKTAPDLEWIYSSLPVDVLSLIVENTAGLKLGDFFHQQIGSVLGINTLKWAALGTHHYGSAYAMISARDIARIAYLLLQRGQWASTSIISSARIDNMTQWAPSLANVAYGPQIKFPTDPYSQERYGRLMWTNRTQSAYVGNGVPADAYYCAGFRTNFAMVIPSMDLIIIRLQSGPEPWSDAVFTGITSKVISAIVSNAENTPPTAQITSPMDGSKLIAPATVTIQANAVDADGSIREVAFYANNTWLGTDATAPYDFTWQGITVGDYILTARSTDDHNATTTSAAITLTVRNNTPPVVQITSPVPGTTLRAPAAFTLRADAIDADGGITKVAFHANTKLLGTDTTTPYGYAWKNIGAGTYAITARSTDNNGVTTISPAVTLTVLMNVPPVVQITSPTPGTSLIAPATVTIRADAMDADGGITKVAFYANTKLLSTDTTAPYGYAWKNIGAGTYAITARATDNNGAMTISPTVTLTVRNNVLPVVQITSPTAGTSLRAPATVTIRANATDADGKITKVAFYANTKLLGTDTTTPYGYTWKNIGIGTYALTARGTDNNGATTISPIVNITVKP